MSEERILVGMKRIAAYLDVSRDTARKICKKIKPPFLEGYLPTKAVLESDLLESLKKLQQ